MISSSLLFIPHPWVGLRALKLRDDHSLRSSGRNHRKSRPSPRSPGAAVHNAQPLGPNISLLLGSCLRPSSASTVPSRSLPLPGRFSVADAVARQPIKGMTAALVVCPGVTTAQAGLGAHQNAMPNCRKCGHPGHTHFKLTRGECCMCPCSLYQPNSYRSKIAENNIPVRVNNWYLRRRRRK